MTTVQLVQLHSMPFEPILLYPNKKVSALDSFQAGHPLTLSSPASWQALHECNNLEKTPHFLFSC